MLGRYFEDLVRLISSRPPRPPAPSSLPRSPTPPQYPFQRYFHHIIRRLISSPPPRLPSPSPLPLPWSKMPPQSPFQRYFQHIIRRLISSPPRLPSQMPPWSPTPPRQSLAGVKKFPPQPPGTFNISIQWAPSYGVNVHAFKYHGIFPLKDKNKYKNVPHQIFDVQVFNEQLRVDLEHYWPDLECYDDVSKYELFWYYQWENHGIYSGDLQEVFFKKAVDFIKPLPHAMGLSPGRLTTVQEMLNDLKKVIRFECGLKVSRIRGHISVHDKRYYAMRVVDEARIATDELFNPQDTWRDLCGAATAQQDKIFLPYDALDRYKSPVDKTETLYVKGQGIQIIHMHREFEKQRSREKIYMEENAISFMILENEQSHKKLAVLVISARPGAFDAEQEKMAFEHVHKAETWGISHLLVVVSKMVENNEKWDERRFKKIELKMKNMLRGSIYQNCAKFIPISSKSNVQRKVEKAIGEWWKGGSLFGYIDQFQAPIKDEKGHLRMSIFDKFDDNGHIVVEGVVESGTIVRGANLLMSPSKVHVKIIEILDGETVKNEARPNEFVQVQLSGIEDQQISQGCVLSSVENSVNLASVFEAQLSFLDLLNDEKICIGSKMYLHIHSTVVECEIVELIEEFDPNTRISIRKKPTYVKKGSLVSSKIQVKRLICIEKYSDVPGLGHFVLQFEGRIIAFGKVTALVAQS